MRTWTNPYYVKAFANFWQQIDDDYTCYWAPVGKQDIFHYWSSLAYTTSPTTSWRWADFDSGSFNSVSFSGGT
jgi:hypothetical protein